MFASLSDKERRTLAAKLRHAGVVLGDEANKLADAPAEVRAAYSLPRDSYHGFYSAAIECSELAITVSRAGWVLPTRATGTGWPS